MRAGTLILAAAAVALAFSCTDDGGAVISDITEMGTVVNGRIVNDMGLTYTVTEDGSGTRWNAMDRILYNCDILTRTSPTAYDIRLKAAMEPGIMQIVTDAEATEAPESDPAQIFAAWAGGGYLNIGFRFLVKESSQEPAISETHSFSVEAFPAPEVSDTLFLYLRHDAGGEFFGQDDSPASDYKTVTSYACIPLGEVIAPGGSRDVCLSWIWHKSSEEGELLTGTELLSTAARCEI